MAERTSNFSNLPLSTSGPIECSLDGVALLETPAFNKGSAFSLEEREAFGLSGLLPSRVGTLSDQVKRAYQQCQERRTPLGKNTFMTSLKDQNEVLYYRICQDYLKEMMPIIYTPTEGEAIANYSRLFRRPAGTFLNINNPGGIETALAKSGKSADDVDIIACSDGEQILGIGDQGVGAILISIAKLVLYTLCAGIHPGRTLPVVLDVGTDNDQLLNDPVYLGLQLPRARGEKYDAFIDRFIRACGKQYPKAYIHFEDFGLQNARRILDKYMARIACFNDDVQGTGCVTLAALYAACHVAGYKIAGLRVVIFGAGSAGIGIADQIRDAIAVESGKSKEEATRQIWCVDKAGLLLVSHGEDLSLAQKDYARPESEWMGSDNSLLHVVSSVKPHVMIGTSTKPRSFTKDIVQEMAKHVERPIIFPLSNPTKLHEAVPSDLVQWTDGKVLTATGSPFPPVEFQGRTIEIGECDNSTTFPGIGLGVVLSRARLITPKMLVVAVKALAAQAPALQDPGAALLPDVTHVRDVSVQIAAAVIKQAVSDGLAQEKGIPTSDGDLEAWIREQMWEAQYRPLKRVAKNA